MKKIDKKGVVDIQNQQLLDNSSDFNNFENLSYFIGEYKKAKAIIAQCKSFYQNFLRTKLYSINELQKIKGINLIDLKLDNEAYASHVQKLVKYILIKKAAKELEEVSDTYGLKFFQYIPPDEGKTYNYEKNVWRIYPKKDALLKGNSVYTYLTSFLDGNYYHNKIENEYVSDGYTYFYDHKVNADYVNLKYAKKHKTQSNLEPSYESKYKGEDKKTHKGIYEHVPRKDKKGNLIEYEFYKLSKKELELIDFISNFTRNNLYDDLYNEIYLNPDKYQNTWVEYINFMSENYKDENNSIIWFDVRDYHRKIRELKEEEKRKYLLCPAVYLKLKPMKVEDYHPQWNRETYEKYVVDETCYVDASKYINKDYLKLYLDWKHDQQYRYHDDYIPKTYVETNRYGEKTYIDTRCETFDTDLFSYLAINVPQLLEIIKSEGEFTNVDFSEYHSTRLPSDFYFTIVNGTPFKFADDLSSVKIKYEEDKNMLECTYENEHRGKKYAWPSDAPWIVTTYFYSLYFDCNTNEPIKYSFSKDTVEESCKHRY